MEPELAARNLLAGQAEGVVEHEGDPLGRRQRLEDYLEDEADRISQERFLFGIEARSAGGSPAGHRTFASRLSGAEHIQADAGDDCRQPAAQVLDLARPGAAHPQPGLLNGVLGFGARPGIR